MKFLVFIILCFFSIQSFASQIEFKFLGKSLEINSLEQLKKILHVKKIKVFEPHMQVERTYVGFSVNELFKLKYKGKLKQAEEVLMTCSDGYQSSIPLVEFKKNDAYLVFSLENSAEPFRLINKMQAGEVVDIGPFYLIWDNVKNASLRKDGASYWPYQVTSIDLIQFKDKFSKILPPANSSKMVMNGFLQYRKHCMSCHAINGQGGGKGIDFNVPINITKVRSVEWVSRWALNPELVRPGTSMPKLNPDMKNREKVAQEIYAYIKSLAK